jgi:hypothetical protein
MSTIAQRIHREQMPGYWAVEVRQSAAAGPGKQYLCQAPNDRAAAAIAGRLMGSDLSVRGFDYYWIEKDLLDRTGATLPPLGQHQEVTGPEAWTALMAAHRASELAAAAERGGA